MYSPNHIAVADPIKDLYRKKKKKTERHETGVFWLVLACFARLFFSRSDARGNDDDRASGVRAPA